jgi:hypothetical protein
LQDETRVYERDWTHATVTDEPNTERHPVAHVWIDPGDARFKDLIADMWKDLKLRNRFQKIVEVLTTIETYLKAKSKLKETESLQMQAFVMELSELLLHIQRLYAQLPSSTKLMKEGYNCTRIDAAYTEQRQTVLDTHKNLQVLVLETRVRLQAYKEETLSRVKVS